MPAWGFFRTLGLFVFPDFLRSDSCRDLCQAMSSAPVERAVIIGENGETRVDPDTRKVNSGILPEGTTVSLKQRLRDLQPLLEKHFAVQLDARFETPQYLIYRPGDFFKAHRDFGESDGKEGIRTRRVSVVLFLNEQSKESAEGCYGQGSLTFYGLLDGPQWESCGLELNAEQGLLVAFPADKLHEVKPISHGQRFTVVTWFHVAEDGESGSQL